MVRNLLYLLIGAFSVALLTPRPPVEEAPAGFHLAVVLDTSGSMKEEGRIDEAREAILALGEALGPRDSLTLITFDREAEVLIAAARPSSRGLWALLSSVEPAGPTNLHAGLLNGQAQLLDLQGSRRRVIITDGPANAGGIAEGPLLRSAGALREDGVSVSVLGLGVGEPDILHTLGGVGGGGFTEGRGRLRPALLAELEALHSGSVRSAS